jgi:glycosyltransferase involved in cell wall biosynthesis
VFEIAASASTDKRPVVLCSYNRRGDVASRLPERGKEVLRLALITDHPEDNEKVDGGVQAVTRYLVDALLQHRELELHVISFRYGNEKPKRIEANGYIRHLLPGARLGTLTGFWKDQKTLQDCLSAVQPSVVHAQGAGHDGIVAVRSKYPAVITIHEIMTEEAKYRVGHADRARHRLLNMLSERYCIGCGKHTILISPYVAEYFQERLSGARYFIPNPIADSFFSIRRNEDPCRVLFAGRLMPRKGVMDLVRATSIVAKSTSIELILAGSLDDGPYVDQLRRAAADSGIGSLMRFRGLLNEDELREELARCAVLVLPSYQETAPMVIIEAMAAGVPVIATNVGGIRYQVKDEDTGFLIAPGDVNALSERLIALLASRSLRESFGTAARSFASEDYRADKVAAKTIDVYRQMLL